MKCTHLLSRFYFLPGDIRREFWEMLTLPRDMLCSGSFWKRTKGEQISYAQAIPYVHAEAAQKPRNEPKQDSQAPGPSGQILEIVALACGQIHGRRGKLHVPQMAPQCPGTFTRIQGKQDFKTLKFRQDCKRCQQGPTTSLLANEEPLKLIIRSKMIRN